MKIFPKFFIASIVVVALSGAVPNEPFSRHLDAVLKDPDSAKVKIVDRNTDRICGQYNAKNSYGGYVGFKPFVYVIKDDVLYAGYTVVESNLKAYEPSSLINENMSFEELMKKMDLMKELMARIDEAHASCPDA